MQDDILRILNQADEDEDMIHEDGKEDDEGESGEEGQEGVDLDEEELDGEPLDEE